MSFIVWHEWYNALAIKKMTEMGTLPIERTEIAEDPSTLEGEELAEMIVERALNEDFERFREGGAIVIMEPANHAGTYDIYTEYAPSFTATKRDPDEE